MPLTETRAPTDASAELKHKLLELSPSEFERLAGALIGALLDVPVWVARSGSQRGGDVSTTGQRDLKVEARRYSDATRLDERGIIGQIDQSIEQNNDLEAWILATTQTIPDQIILAGKKKAQQEGIAFVPFGWSADHMPRFAAVLASFPEIATEFLGRAVQAHLSKISDDPQHEIVVHQFRKELDSWAIGFQAVRTLSHGTVEQLWTKPHEARALLNQDVAGGAQGKRFLRRAVVFDALERWHQESLAAQPVVLVGRDGVGKTWSAMDWVQDRLENLPIVIVLSSQNLGGPPPSSPAQVIDLIAKQLFAFSNVRDEPFWKSRVLRLLKRPVEEGAVFLLVFDGLNEPASNKWIPVLRQFAGEQLREKTRILATVRRDFFETRLNRLSSLRPTAAIIDVGSYDLSAGGEFDQKLEMEGLDRSALSKDIIDLASVPRFFNLVVKLKDQLESTAEITVSRLLWEYGRSDLFDASAENFSEDGWHAFILKLAEAFRQGAMPTDVNQLSAGLAAPTLTADEISGRVSSIVNGLCADLQRGGKLAFKDNFVQYALGLAILDRLQSEPDTAAASSALEAWLDSISGFDERGAVLEAAVCLAAAAPDQYSGPGVSATLAALVQSQNLPEKSIERLAVLCPALPNAFLDAIEHLPGPGQATARYLAMTAFSDVKRDDPDFAGMIAQSAARWLSRISLDRSVIDGDPDDETSSAGRRKTRLMERLNTAEIGAIIEIAGHQFTLVEYAGSDLLIAGAQMLQGRPLQNCGAFFEAASIHAAIVGSHLDQDTMGWLNRLNTIDPLETAAALRKSAEKLLACDTPDGVASHVKARAAALVLWNTGFEQDSVRASELDPKIDNWISYEKDYLAKPSQSFIALERRHMRETLLDTDVQLVRRIERTRSCFLDPTFEVPSTFITELIQYAKQFDVSQLNIGRGRTPADGIWEDLSIALARCAPDILAELERESLKGFSTRPLEQRQGAAIAADEAYLLIGDDERASISNLRKRLSGCKSDHENSIENSLLAAEIQGLPAVDQYRLILGANLDRIYTDLAEAAAVPSAADVDTLVSEFAGDEVGFPSLIDLLAHNQVELSEDTFDKVFAWARTAGDGDKVGAVWPLMSRSATKQFAQKLIDADWFWSSDDRFWSSYHGSKALALAEPTGSFESIASRISPAFLLRFLSKRSGNRQDTELVANILTKAVLQIEVAPQVPVAELIIDQELKERGHYDYSVGQSREEIENADDFRYALEAFSNSEERARKHSAAVSEAIEQVNEARKRGARLHLIQIRADDFDLIFKHCPDAVDIWLDGLEKKSEELVRRIRLAEGFYIALCRKLLDCDAQRGALLWRLLREKLFTRFQGVGGVSELIHMVFQAKNSPEVRQLKDLLYTIDEAQTDADLVDLVVAVRVSQQEGWLSEKVAADKASFCPAHRLRAAFLEPLIRRPNIGSQSDWPTGVPHAGPEAVGRASWSDAQHEAYAHHWVRRYAEATKPEDAHAAWKLVETSSDPRIKVWLKSVYNDFAVNPREPFDMQKRSFAHARRRELDKAMSKHAKPWQDKFGGRRISKPMLPWNGGTRRDD